jgi:hypothetical protein
MNIKMANQTIFEALRKSYVLEDSRTAQVIDVLVDVGGLSLEQNVREYRPVDREDALAYREGLHSFPLKLRLTPTVRTA